MARDAASVAQNWARAMGNASTKAQQGVDSVTESPMEKAASEESTAKYLQGVQESVSSGRRGAALRAKSLADWKQAMKLKGIPRMGTGALEAQARMQSFLGAWLPHVEAGKRMVRAMPSQTREQRKARMLAMFEHNSQFSYQK